MCIAGTLVLKEAMSWRYKGLASWPGPTEVKHEQMYIIYVCVLLNGHINGL